MNNKELRDKINTAYENTVGVEGVGTGYESFVDELLTLIQQVRVEGVELLKREVMDSCDGIISNDKTPRYSYGKKGKNTLNAEGRSTGDGSRWSTPREIAESLKKYLSTLSDREKISN